MREGTKRLRRVAYHEAGHAVAAYVLRLPMREVSIIEEADSLGHMEHAPTPWFQPDVWYGDDRRTEHRIEARIICALAGPAAEARWGGRRNRVGAGQDERNALDLADYVAGDPTGEGARLYVAWLRHRAEGLVRRELYWAAVEALAAELLARRRVGARRARAIIKQAITAQLGLRVSRNAEGRVAVERVEAPGR
jgi:Peptidase family M41